MTVARDFDLGQTGPPLSLSVDFIAGGLVTLLSGLASVALLIGYAWWAPILLGGAWLSTHWLLRESGVWKDRNTDEVRSAQQDADYAYRMAVDPPAAKEVRLFGLADWVLDRFTRRRVRLHQLQYQATRMRERSILICLVLVFAATGPGLLGAGQRRRRRPPRPRRHGHLRPGRAQRLVDRLRWPQLGPGRRVRPGRRGAPARTPDRTGRGAGLRRPPSHGAARR
jgi:hypothetical protein